MAKRPTREGLASVTRKTIIDIAKRRQRPGSGGQRESERRPYVMRWPDIGEVLRDVLWAVAGGVATRSYMPERVTQDLDVVILVRDAATANARLEAAGYRRRAPLAVPGTSWESPEGVPIDLLEEDGSWEEALRQAASNRDDHGLPVLPLPYLVLMKTRSGWPQDVGDVSRMLGLAPDEALDAVRALVARRALDLLEDVESLIALGKLEWEQPQRRTEAAARTPLL